MDIGFLPRGGDGDTMDSCCSVNGGRVEDAYEATPRHVRGDETSSAVASNLGEGGSNNEVITSPAYKAATVTRIVDVLGENTQHNANPAFEQHPAERYFRPSEFIKLLNSTPLRTVISERQLLRHRYEGGFMEGGQRRIGLMAYVAWLVRKRHEPRTIHFRKKSEAGVSESKRRKRSQVTPTQVMNLLRSQDFRCALSGRELKPDTSALDHILPISRGGIHSIENAQVLDKEVNRAKGTLTNEEFVRLCSEVVTTMGRHDTSSGNG
jgi:5-methylcytosine-specific restriction endonuclease McrA